MCVLLQPFGSKLIEGNESCVFSFRMLQVLHDGIRCTLIIKRNSENAHNVTIGAAEM